MSLNYIILKDVIVRKDCLLAISTAETNSSDEKKNIEDEITLVQRNKQFYIKLHVNFSDDSNNLYIPYDSKEERDLEYKRLEKAVEADEL